MNHSQQLNLTPGESVHDTEVTDSDVLSGRGNGVAYREGNKFYTRLIKENQEEYQNHANGKRKKQIASGIMDIIKSQDPPGRFLKSKKDEAFVWVVQNDHFAMKKVTQALREKPKHLKGLPPSPPAEEQSEGSEQRQSLKRSIKNHSSKVLIESSEGQNFPEPDLITSEEQKVEQVLNPNYRPMKRSVTGDSKKRFYKWMSSVSRLKLLQNSVQSIGEGSNGEGLSPDEIQDAMVKLSADDIGERVDGSDGSDEADELDELDEFDGSDTLDELDLKPISSTKLVLHDMSFKSISTTDSNIKDEDLREAMLRLTSDEINKSMANLNISSKDVADEKNEVVAV